MRLRIYTARKIKHIEIHTRAIHQRWIHEYLTLQITVSWLPSASLPGHHIHYITFNASDIYIQLLQGV